MALPNTFEGSFTSTRNFGIYAICEEIINFRKQLTPQGITASQSGWGDPLNKFMVDWLNRLSQTVATVTYSLSGITPEQMANNAKDTDGDMADEVTAQSINSDETVMPPNDDMTFRWLIDGTDKDVPQVTKEECPNEWMFMFIANLDKMYRLVTRLDSRHNGSVITVSDSIMVHAKINELMTICQRKGGEANRIPVPVGTLPSQEDGTFKENPSA